MSGELPVDEPNASAGDVGGDDDRAEFSVVEFTDPGSGTHAGAASAGETK